MNQFSCLCEVSLFTALGNNNRVLLGTLVMSKLIQGPMELYLFH